MHLPTRLAPFARHILAKKNVTRNIALKSTTYAKINVTLDVTLLHGNITFVRFASTLPPHRELVHGFFGTVFIYITLWVFK